MTCDFLLDGFYSDVYMQVLRQTVCSPMTGHLQIAEYGNDVSKNE